MDDLNDEHLRNKHLTFTK